MTIPEVLLAILCWTVALYASTHSSLAEILLYAAVLIKNAGAIVRTGINHREDLEEPLLIILYH